MKQLADSLGDTPEQRRKILEMAGAGKELFSQKYKGRWNDTLAGAMTFFIVSTCIVTTGDQPTAEAEQRLFASLDGTLSTSDIGRASNAEKTALYNVLLAGASVPLVICVEGKQNKNDALVEQARTMAAGLSRKFLGKDVRELTAMLQGGAYDGWRGARINDAIVFRKDDHSNPRAGDGIRNGDIRCGRRSG